MLRKVIVSHLGEVTQDTRTIGDRIRYRIYYQDRTRVGTNIVITDPLDKNLSEVIVIGSGQYDRRTHTVTWEISNLLPRRDNYVEFEATIRDTKLIRNKAYVQEAGRREKVTNTVETTVIGAPTLGWIPFIDDAIPGEPPRIYMKDETTMGTTVRVDIPGVFVYEEKVDGVAYHHISIPGRAELTEVGKPELPIVGGIIEVPFDVRLMPEIVEAEIKEVVGYNVYPAQPPRIDAPPASEGLILDPSTYLKNVDYPAALSLMADEDIAVIRGHRVAFLKVNPIHYNPVIRVVTVYPTLEVQINYDRPAQLAGVNRRMESPAFEELLQASVLNYKEPQRFYRDSSAGVEEKNGCDYLIITHGAFYNEQDANNPIVRLANWKTRKGYTTRVIRVGSIQGGNKPKAIQTYIQDAYEHWNPVPSYVLLVGDSNLVEAFADLKHPDEKDKNSPQPPFDSDLYYTTVDGNDYFPDIYIGRLSVDNLQQLRALVDKILSYEQTPPATPANNDFYNDVSLLGLFTDEDGRRSRIDGRERRPWIANLETIRQHLTGENYTVERIYRTDSGFPGNPRQRTPERFCDGTRLPEDLRFPRYQWDGDTADITAAFNNGRFLMTYRAHGGSDGWGDPSFSNVNVGRLTQNDLTPVVFSITCQTGWFDNETDKGKGARPDNDESFAETCLRQARGGAVALQAMVRNSWTGWNDFLMFGKFKAIWPEFEPRPHWTRRSPISRPNIPNIRPVRLLRMGQILNFSRLFMAQAYGATNIRKVEFEMEHLFGDPEMPIWTQVPGNLEVTHPEGIGAKGLQEFIVQVINKADNKALQNATVVLTRDNDIVQMWQTNTAGLVRFSFNNIGKGNLDITVTALHFRPYMATITVTTDGAELNRLDPTDGPEGQTIHAGGKGFQNGENVEIKFGTLAPKTVVADASGEFGQGTSTVEITVPAGHAHGLVNVVAHGQTSDLYAVRVFQVRDQNPVDLWTYNQRDSSTWSVHPGDNPTWNSPDIQLYDDSGNSVASNQVQFGKDYVVRVNVRNKTAFPAPQAKVVFKWINAGAGGPWELFHPDSTSEEDIPAGPPGTTAVNSPTFNASVIGHVCVKATIEHLEDTNLSNNEGQENLHIQYSSSPTTACFLFWNMTEHPAPIHLEVRQLIDPNQKQEERLWATWVEHPDPQILQPGNQGQACIIVDPDVADAQPGDQAEFAVTAFIGTQMIGGVNLIIIKR